jgi:hypothetical protein
VNKLLLVTVACVLLISSIGASATVSATQIGHTPIYYFDVTYNGKVVGQAVVNTAAKTPTYALVAHGLTPSTKYTFGYTASGDVHTLGSAKTTTTGALIKYGTFPAADVKDLQSAQFWVTQSPGSSSFNEIYGLDLYNNGWFLAKIACEYSNDGGVTWHESGQTGGIPIWTSGAPSLSALGVPVEEGHTLVKIHVIVVGGVGGAKAKTGSEVFTYGTYCDRKCYAAYDISGTTFKNTLEYEGISCVAA